MSLQGGCFYYLHFIGNWISETLNNLPEITKSVVAKPGFELAMATHSSALAWKIAWTEEPGRLQSMVSWRVGHDWATSLSCIREGNGNPLQCSCLENPRDSGAWWAAVYGVSQSRTRLKRLSNLILGSRHVTTILCNQFWLFDSFCTTFWHRPTR